MGGTGLIGAKLVKVLRQRGHDVVAASLKSGVDVITGEGLEAALQGVEAVVDVLNASSFEPAAVLKFFETSTRHLLAAERVARVKHHVVLSIVGIEGLPDNGYFRAKVAQEVLVRASGVPFTIVRATQFFEFIGGLAQPQAKDASLRLTPALMQPVAADDLVDRLADAVLATARNAVVEVAGPERMSVADAVSHWLVAQGDSREVVRDAQAPYFGAVLAPESLVAGRDAHLGKTTLADWLRSNVAQR